MDFTDTAQMRKSAFVFCGLVFPVGSVSCGGRAELSLSV